jgi:hypothetical protein
MKGNVNFIVAETEDVELKNYNIFWQDKEDLATWKINTDLLLLQVATDLHYMKSGIAQFEYFNDLIEFVEDYYFRGIQSKPENLQELWKKIETFSRV